MDDSASSAPPAIHPLRPRWSGRGPHDAGGRHAHLAERYDVDPAAAVLTGQARFRPHQGDNAWSVPRTSVPRRSGPRSLVALSGPVRLLSNSALRHLAMIRKIRGTARGALRQISIEPGQRGSLLFARAVSGPCA